MLYSNAVATGILSSNHNPMRDFEVISSPDDTVSCMEFSPPSITHNNFLIAGSWDNHVSFWEIESTGNSIPRLQQSMTASVMDVAWSADGSKVFMAGCDKVVKCWDLNSNQCTQVAAHEAPIKTCHWIHTSSKFNNCLMTGSWGQTVKFWDLRVQQPVLTLQYPNQVYCADVNPKMAVVSTAGPHMFAYPLENNPPQMIQISMQNAPLTGEHRCISIFQNDRGETAGFAFGNFGGQVKKSVENNGVNYVNSIHTTTDNFDCHRSSSVNSIKFHPKHGTMATVGSDGTFSFWNKDTRRKLNTSLQMQQPVTSCCFSHDGQIFAYSVGYDWANGVQFINSQQKKSQIFLRPCIEEMKPYK